MAKKFLTHLNLNRNELQNTVIQNLASAPSSPVAGLTYYDTTLGKFGVYSGSAWVYMGDIDGSTFVSTTGNQTVGGVKTFTSFPVTPSSAPTTSYQTANKKYVDDTVSAAGGFTAEDAQDAVGSILTDTATVNLTYNDAANTITADVLDSPTVGGNNTTYLLSRANHTGTQSADTITDGTTNKAYTATEKTKLAGIATGATANATDAALRARSSHTGTQTASTISDFDSAADARITAAAGTTLATLSSGKIPTSQIPSVALSEVFVVATQVAQLALTTQQGDIVIRSDQNRTYVRNAGTAGTMADYTELSSPTDAVTSVNGQTGLVVLGKGDIGLDNVDNTSDAAKPISAAVATALSGKAATSHTHTASNITDFSTAADARITAQKATANGIASLDATTKIPVAQLPTGTTSTTVSLGNHTHTAATTAAAGFTTLASKAEADAKTVTTKAVTPAALVDFARKHTSLIGGSTSVAVTHGLGSQWVTAQAYDATTNELVECDITLTSATVTTFGFTTAPAANSIRVVITG